jgi:hypothetical protein
MAKAPRKLKVFQTRLGFHDAVIATGSRAAALRGWGIRQDLFAQGLAAEVTDPGIVAAATAHPDKVLRRPAGSDQPFSASPPRLSVADLEPEPEPQPAEGKKKTAAPALRVVGEPARKPDRTKLNKAEAELKALDREREEDEAKFQRELDAIASEEKRLRDRRLIAENDAADRARRLRKRRTEAEENVEREERAYRRSGGED